MEQSHTHDNVSRTLDTERLENNSNLEENASQIMRENRSRSDKESSDNKTAESKKKFVYQESTLNRKIIDINQIEGIDTINDMFTRITNPSGGENIEFAK